MKPEEESPTKLPPNATQPLIQSNESSSDGSGEASIGTESSHLQTITERTNEESCSTHTSQSQSHQIMEELKTAVENKKKGKNTSFVIIKEIKRIEEFDDIEEKPYFLRKSSIYIPAEEEKD